MVTWLEMYSVVQHDTVHFWSRKPSEAENAKIQFQNICQILTVHHAIISPLILQVYGVVHLLYGVVTSDSMYWVVLYEKRDTHQLIRK